MSTVLGERSLPDAGNARRFAWLAVAVGLAALYLPVYLDLALDRVEELRQQAATLRFGATRPPRRSLTAGLLRGSARWSRALLVRCGTALLALSSPAGVART